MTVILVILYLKKCYKVSIKCFVCGYNCSIFVVAFAVVGPRRCVSAGGRTLLTLFMTLFWCFVVVVVVVLVVIVLFRLFCCR